MPETGSPSEKQKLSEIAKHLNVSFKQGRPAYELLPEIRAFPKPIVIDFNNVLANNDDPLIPNPHASAFLDKLNKVGNIFIVTTATSWDLVNKFLADQKMLKKDTVLMVADNYQFLASGSEGYRDEEVTQANKLWDEYSAFAKVLSNPPAEGQIKRSRSGTALAKKHLAPLFLKPFNVPIVDDAGMATYDNPGMLGIQVDKFMPVFYEDDPDYNYDGSTLNSAAAIVEEHYAGAARS